MSPSADLVTAISQLSKISSLKLGENVAELTVGESMLPAVTLSRSNQTRRIVELFEKEGNLFCAVIVDENERPTGIVNKDRLYNHLGSGYGRSVFLDRSIELVMESDFLVVESHQTIASVSQFIIARESASLTDVIVVVDREVCVGLISVRKLLELTTRSQANLVQGQARILNAMSEMIAHIADLSLSIENLTKDVALLVERIRKVSHQGRSVMDESIRLNTEIYESMSQQKKVIQILESLSRNIIPFSHTISKVSDKTHMLSFNASIEAARAGDHGRGFKIVAEEVERLAGQTSGAAKKIDFIIQEVLEGIQDTINISSNLHRKTEEASCATNDARNSVDMVFRLIEDINPQMNHVYRMASDIYNNTDRLSGVVELLASEASRMAAGKSQ